MNRKVLWSNITQLFKKAKNDQLSLYLFLLGLLITAIVALGLALPTKSYAALNCSYTVSGQDPSSEEVRQYVRTVYAISEGSDAALDVAMQELPFKTSGLNFFGLISKAMKAHEVACYLQNQDYDSAAITAATEATKMAFEYVFEGLGIGSVLSVAKLGTIPIEWSLNYFKDTAVQIARNNQTKMYIKARFAGISHETIMAGISNDDLLFESGWLKCVVPAGICFTGLQAVDPVGYTREDVYGVAKQLYESYVAAATFERENKMIGEELAKQFTPNISNSPEYPEFADEVTFTAAGRAFDEMNIVEYNWDFGDGNTASGKTVTHRYQYPDSYIVTLYAQDSGGQNHQYTTSIYVSPPRISVDFSSYESLDRSFSTQNKSCGDPAASPCVTQYTWDFGNGVVETSNDNTKTYTYPATGSYNVTVTITLDDNSTVQGSTSIFVGPGTRYINGHTIYGSETWYSGGTYVVGGVIVAPGATLTIEPGSVVKFGNTDDLKVNGTLIADGTAENPIVFTSIWDDDFGGNTDPPNGEYPTSPGVCYHNGSNNICNNWNYIKFGSSSKNSVIDNVIMRYGGYTGGSYSEMLCIDSSSVMVSQSEISHSKGTGVSVANTSPMLTANTITNNGDYGIVLSSSNAVVTGNVISANGNDGWISAVHLSSSNAIITGNTISNNTGYGIEADSYPTISGNTISGNTNYAMALSSTVLASVGENTITGNTPNNALLISGGTLTKNTTLNAAIGTYVFSDGATMTVPDGVTLTIEPGTVVKFEREGSLAMNIAVNGTLIADGTAENPIVFTSIWDDDFGGNTDPPNGEYPTSPGVCYLNGGSIYCNRWGSIVFGSSSKNSVIDHAIIRYGSDNGYGNQVAVLRINSSSVTVSHSEISHSGPGIGIINASPTLTSNTITANGYIGIDLSSSNAILTDNTISNNGSDGISVSSGSSPTIAGNTITGNTPYGLYYYGTTILDATNNNWGDPSGPLDDSDDRATGGYYNPTGKGDRVSDNVIYYPWSGVTTALGTITVIPLPENLNAPWTLTGPNSFSFTYSDYEGSDATIGYLNPGDYTVTWGGVTGWDQPRPSTQTLASGDSITITGTYQLTAIVANPPTEGTVGSTITINGSNFGATQGGGYVDFNGIHGTIVSWSDTQIVVTVPAGATSGCMTIVTDYGTSSCMDFDVIASIKNDFNLDGISDILWRNTSTGKNLVWYMNGAVRDSYAYMRDVTDTAWTIVGTGDFNSDGNPDILWRNKTTGKNLLWYMNGDVRASYQYLDDQTDLNWRIVGADDFNSDGKPDILWRNTTTGKNVIWYMNGATKTGYAYIAANTDQAWKIVGTGDFNSDGKTDILWRNTTTGKNVIWYMNGATKSGYAYLRDVTDTHWNIVSTGDYNSDGKTDILWRNTSTGQNLIWYMNGAVRDSYAYTRTVTDTAWTIVP